MNVPRVLLQDRFRNSFYPQMQFVFSGSNVAKVKCSAGICNRIERCGERQNHRAHRWMNVAEDIRYAFAREGDCLSGTGFVKTEIETLAVEEREDIMKERIGVGELHSCADGDNQQVRREHAVLLQQRVVSVSGKRWSGSLLHRLQPEDCGRDGLF